MTRHPIEEVWLERAKQQAPEMDVAELKFFVELRRRNMADKKFCNQRCRAFRKLVKMARSGNEYAAIALRELEA